MFLEGEGRLSVTTSLVRGAHGAGRGLEPRLSPEAALKCQVSELGGVEAGQLGKAVGHREGGFRRGSSDTARPPPSLPGCLPGGPLAEGQEHTKAPLFGLHQKLRDIFALRIVSPLLQLRATSVETTSVLFLYKIIT